MSNSVGDLPLASVRTIGRTLSFLFVKSPKGGGGGGGVFDKREFENAILNTKEKNVLPLFSVCNIYMGVY